MILSMAWTIQAEMEDISLAHSLMPHIREHGFRLDDECVDTPGTIQITPFSVTSGLTDESAVSITVADVDGGSGCFLASNWDMVDQIIDQIEIAAIKSFGDRPSVPATPTLLT